MVRDDWFVLMVLAEVLYASPSPLCLNEPCFADRSHSTDVQDPGACACPLYCLET